MRTTGQYTRVIDGREYKVTTLPTGYGGRSISKDAFGGRKGARGHKAPTSQVEKQAKV